MSNTNKKRGIKLFGECIPLSLTLLEAWVSRNGGEPVTRKSLLKTKSEVLKYYRLTCTSGWEQAESSSCLLLYTVIEGNIWSSRIEI